jgi:hypothetical protein
MYQEGGIMRKVLFAWTMAAMAALAPGWTLAGETEDEVVANQIAKNLKDSGRLQNYRIGVAFRDGTAWLNGSVTDDAQLVAALEVAQQTEGVSKVVNRLEAKPTDGASKPSISNRLQQSAVDLRSDSSDAKAAPAHRNDEIQLTTSQVEEQVARQAQVRSQWPQDRAAQSMPQPQRQMRQRQMQQPVGPARRVAMAPQRMPQQAPQRVASRNNSPRPYAQTARANPMNYASAQPSPGFVPGTGRAIPARYDHANMPNYAWPSYAAHPNYAAVTYPKQYSPTAWPYIGPFYPYPQVPLGWRKVTLQWDDGWWMLDFHERH